MAEKHKQIAAVALAGGASSRMGRPKALAPFLGQPLVARVLGRLRPQAGAVYLNASGVDYARFGAPLAPDAPRWRGAGPLAGVEAALRRARDEGFAFLVTAPCDAPFLPLDLVARLLAAGEGGAAVAVSETGWEPMFALLPVSALARVEAALAAGRASPRSVLEGLQAARATFPAEGTPFANLNTPEDFTAAEAAARLEDDRSALAGARPDVSLGE
jgi:molybdopterin-guanine dinucleotide biosynthesis protein A